MQPIFNDLNDKTFTKSKFKTTYHKLQPKINIDKEYNVVIMYDPDAPNGMGKLNNKTFIHMLKVNDATILQYIPPTPPKGRHRYVLKAFTPLEI